MSGELFSSLCFEGCFWTAIARQPVLCWCVLYLTASPETKSQVLIFPVLLGIRAGPPQPQERFVKNVQIAEEKEEVKIKVQAGWMSEDQMREHGMKEYLASYVRLFRCGYFLSFGMITPNWLCFLPNKSPEAAHQSHSAVLRSGRQALQVTWVWRMKEWMVAGEGFLFSRLDPSFEGNQYVLCCSQVRSLREQDALLGGAGRCRRVPEDDFQGSSIGSGIPDRCQCQWDLHWLFGRLDHGPSWRTVFLKKQLLPVSFFSLTLGRSLQDFLHPQTCRVQTVSKGTKAKPCLRFWRMSYLQLSFWNTWMEYHRSPERCWNLGYFNRYQ